MDCGCTNAYIGPSLADTCGGGAFLMFMTLLDTFIRNKCDLSEVCQRVEPTRSPDEWYDFIVIGGGSGGATAAGKLAELPQFKTLLVEAGGDEPPGSQVPSMVVSYHGNHHMDWNYKTEPEKVACQGYPGKKCSWPRGKVLGGCSVINGMMYMRGTPKDYDNWGVNNSGWSYKDVLPEFIKHEDNLEVGTLVDKKYHGQGGPLTTKRFNDQPQLAYDILDGAKELGYVVSKDLNGVQYQGFTIAQSNTRNGARLSSARAYVRPQRNKPNFHVMLNSTAVKINLQQSGNEKKAQSVEILYNGRLYTVKVRKEVILAAGAINTPQVLLLSGIGPKNELQKLQIPVQHDLPGVGKNLQNHVTFYMSYLMDKEKSYTDLDWASALNYILNRQGPMSSTGMSQLTARINSKYADKSGDYPDLQIFFAGYLASCAKTGEVRAAEDSPRHLTVSPVTLHPKSKGYVTLRNNNSFEAPIMVANYLSEQDDADVLVDGIRVIQRLMNTTVLREKYGLKLDKEDYGDCAKLHGYDTDKFWNCAIRYYTGPENHQASSCRMGPESDKLACVNNKLQVYGIPNIRIMDASVMPYLVSGNTHATIVMIAERGVGFIKAKWSIPNTVVNRNGFDETTVRNKPGQIKPTYPHPSYPAPHHPDFHHNLNWHNKHGGVPNPFNKQDQHNQHFNQYQANQQYQPSQQYQHQRPEWLETPRNSRQNYNPTKSQQGQYQQYQPRQDYQDYSAY